MTNDNTRATVVKTGNGAAGWFLIGGIFVAILVGAYFYLGGEVPDQEADVELKLELPKAE